MTNVLSGLSFGEALVQLYAYAELRRAGWNGPGMAIALQEPDEHSKMEGAYVYIRGADGLRVPWTPSQVDILATDWEVVEDE